MAFMSLDKGKRWLKLDGTEEDELVQDILGAIEVYFENAIDNYNNTNEKMMKILSIPTIALLSDMYENRTLTVNSSKEQLRYLVQSAILQAKTCYPEEEVV